MRTRKAKRGRPRVGADEAKKNVSVYLTQPEFDQIEKLSAKSGLTKSSYIRQCLFYKEEK